MSTQLRLLQGGRRQARRPQGARRYLDAPTRQVGQRGVARARRVLADISPPVPVRRAG